MAKTPDTVRRLLSDSAGIRKRFDARWRMTGEKYNIFTVAGIAHKEVIMCRVLADLLDPQGKHGQGSRFLALFWKTISPKLPEWLDLDIENTKVTAEYVIDENRRIDITLEDGRIFVPIEVKIWAGDQQKQIADYFAFAKTKNKDIQVPVLYLTVDGHEPHDFSKAGVGRNDYVTLSFRDDILAWLDACAQGKATVPVQENLRQLIAAIKSLCGKSEDAEMEDAIYKLITKDDDSVRAALDICRAVNFDNRILETCEETGSMLKRLRDKFPDFEFLQGDGWKYFNVNIKDDKYWFQISHLWDKACVMANPDKGVSVTRAEGKALYEKMSTQFGIRPSQVNGCAWYSEETKWPDFARDDLYQFRLCKLYTENTQKVADRIISIVRELEKA